MQNDLIAIGFWFSKWEPHFPHPQTLVGEAGEKEKQMVANYLDAGLTFISYLGFSGCRFDCGAPESEMGTSDYTDGVWVWPEGLSHYIRNHDIILPIEFIEHAEKNNWVIPPDTTVPVVDTGQLPVDFNFWIERYASRKMERKSFWKRAVQLIKRSPYSP